MMRDVVRERWTIRTVGCFALEVQCLCLTVSTLTVSCMDVLFRPASRVVRDYAKPETNGGGHSWDTMHRHWFSQMWRLRPMEVGTHRARCFR